MTIARKRIANSYPHDCVSLVQVAVQKLHAKEKTMLSTHVSAFLWDSVAEPTSMFLDERLRVPLTSHFNAESERWVKEL